MSRLENIDGHSRTQTKMNSYMIAEHEQIHRIFLNINCIRFLLIGNKISSFHRMSRFELNVNHVRITASGFRSLLTCLQYSIKSVDISIDR
jgi:hypothetical protein